MATATYDGQVDLHSIGTNDNTRMMIKKMVQWTVESEPGQRAASEQEVDTEIEDAERCLRLGNSLGCIVYWSWWQKSFDIFDIFIPSIPERCNRWMQ